MGKKKEQWIKSFESILEKGNELRNSGAALKKYVLPVVVSGAVICFWIFGSDGNRSSTVTVEGEAHTAESIHTEDGTRQEVYDADDIYVDIGGEVLYPGVYQIPAGTRLFQVIEKAGGLKEAAATDLINQAEPVSDGQKIIIGSLNEASPYYVGNSVEPYQNTNTGEIQSAAVRMTEDGVIVNINRATSEELQLIPGVGPSTAQKIIEYRTEHGGFSAPEDLKQISGIGEKTYENLKDYIET